MKKLNLHRLSPAQSRKWIYEHKWSIELKDERNALILSSKAGLYIKEMEVYSLFRVFPLLLDELQVSSDECIFLKYRKLIVMRLQ